MSSWLDNIAAHCEEEDEEDYESQPQLKTSTPNSQQQAQLQEPQEQPQKSEPQNLPQNPQSEQQPQPNQQKQSELPPNSQEEKIKSESIKKNENDQNKPENELPKDKESNNSSSKSDKATKIPPYSNTITKEMYKFDKSINFLLKRQEFYYAGSMIKIRSSLDFALERTSKPIQTIGGLGTVSLEAKGKYDVLKKRIMNLQPLCSVTPKSK